MCKFSQILQKIQWKCAKRTGVFKLQRHLFLTSMKTIGMLVTINVRFKRFFDVGIQQFNICKIVCGWNHWREINYSHLHPTNILCKDTFHMGYL